MASSFKTLDQPALAGRPFKVIIVGAGLTSCHIAARFREFTTGIHFQFYEKNATVGGTWTNNIYPGVACDVPSHGYTLPEHPFLGWKSFQAPGADCQRYAEFLAKKTHIADYTRFNVKVLSAEWQEKEGTWLMKAVDTKTGEAFTDTANVFINSTGLLCQAKYPELSGLKDFKGPVMHSAEWKPDTDFKDKRIALIGGGSSAMQCLPELQQKGKYVDQYLKSTTWVTPMFAAEERDRFFDFKDGLLSGYRSQDIKRVNPDYTEEHVEKLKDPEEMQKHRRNICSQLNELFHKGITRKGSKTGQDFKDLVIDLTNQRLEQRPDLKQFFLPNWTPGCRRPTPSPYFWNSVLADNVNIIPHKVVQATSKGLIDDTGKEREYDILAFATGFWVDFAPPFDVIGRNGLNLRGDKFRNDPTCYMVCTYPDMPNYFTPSGPFVNSLNGEFLCGIAKISDYIIKCVMKLQQQRYKSMCPKPEAIADFVAYADEYMKESTHTEECSAWYKRGEVEGKLRSIWPGTVLHMMSLIEDPNWEDFDWEKLPGEERGPARFNYMGNGLARREVETGDCAYYVPLVKDIYKEVPEYGSPDARWAIPVGKA